MSRLYRKKPRIPDLGADVCKRKTANGNVYRSLLAAEAAAAEMRALTGSPVKAYACGACGRFHFGKDRRKR